MNKIIIRIRLAVVKARASEPFGRFIPNNKVVAAALAAGAVTLSRKVGLVDLPAGCAETVAAALVGYLIPENPVVAAHVFKQAGVIDSIEIAQKGAAGER